MSYLREKFQTPQGGALLAMLLSLLVLLPAWFFLANWYRDDLTRQARAKVAEQISARANALTSAVNQRIALLRGLHTFVRTDWPDAYFDGPFEVFASGLYFNSTGVRTLMIAPEGVARYIFPISDAPSLKGYDILNDPDPTVRGDVQRAIHSHEVALSQPGELRQGGFGFTAWQAVYRGTELWGLVSIAVDMDAILADAGLKDPAGNPSVALRGQGGKTFFGSAGLWEQAPVIQSIQMPEGAWELGGVPQGGWEAAVRSSWDLFRLGSLLIVLLLGVMVFLMVNRQGQLAQAVKLRTREIAAAQEELEQRVQERTREASEKSGKLAVLEERQRLARELHDSVSQVLYSIGLGTKTARAALEHNPARIGEALDYVDRLAEAGQVEMRALIFELRPESLRSDGLVAALEKQADVLRARHGLAVQLNLCPEPEVTLEIKEAVYRVSQEAIHNSIKHAQATQVNLTLQKSGEQLCLEVSDNGCGFNASAEFPGHLGLQSMRERAIRLNGQVEIDSAPGRGTKVNLLLPVLLPETAD